MELVELKWGHKEIGLGFNSAFLEARLERCYHKPWTQQGRILPRGRNTALDFRCSAFRTVKNEILLCKAPPHPRLWSLVMEALGKVHLFKEGGNMVVHRPTVQEVMCSWREQSIRSGAGSERKFEGLRWSSRGSQLLEVKSQSMELNWTYIYHDWIQEENQELEFFKNWSITDLQCCVSFCCPMKWISSKWISTTHGSVFTKFLISVYFPFVVSSKILQSYRSSKKSRRGYGLES